MQANPPPRKTILLDRDGTLIIEPAQTQQVNSLAELEFLPYAITALAQLSQAGYKLIVVSNQDGLGSPANPEENYREINRKILQILRGEGAVIEEIFTCPHLPADRCLCRKPGTALLTEYLRNHPLLLSDSFVVGDRHTDLLLARNLGIEGFALEGSGLSPAELGDSVLSRRWDWRQIAEYLLCRARWSKLDRRTKETQIELELCLDGEGRYDIRSGLHFFDHMLEQFSRHSHFDLTLRCDGDLHIDAHHTVEDIAIVLGQGLATASGDKRGIARYSSEKRFVMDEARCDIAVDFSGRPYTVLDLQFPGSAAGDLPTEMIPHFLESLAQNAGITLHMSCSGTNTHHTVEICFKALAHALRAALERSGSAVLSTKGSL